MSRKTKKIENDLPNPDTLGTNLGQVAITRGLLGVQPPWLLSVDDYDMELVKAQWWADKEFGEKGAR